MGACSRHPLLLYTRTSTTTTYYYSHTLAILLRPRSLSPVTPLTLRLFNSYSHPRLTRPTTKRLFTPPFALLNSLNAITMRQTSLASFFKKPAASANQPAAESESPEKVKQKVQKSRVIESDDDEEETTTTTTTTTVTDSKQVKQTSSTAEKEKENEHTTTTTTSTSAVPTKRKVIESPTASPAKKTKKSEGAITVGEPSTTTTTTTATKKKSTDESTETSADISIAEEKKAVHIALVDLSSVTPAEASWKAGAPVPYAALCAAFEKIEATTKRLQILEYITHFFRDVILLTPENLLPCIYLCINQLGPTFSAPELGIGETILMKAVGAATGRSMAKIKADYEEVGDLGTVAQASKSTQRMMFQPKPLTVVSVFKTLKDIAALTGHSSQNKKIEKINSLLVSCRGNESKYLIRSLEGKLRIGLAEQTVIVALAQSRVLADASIKKSEREGKMVEAAEIIKDVYSQCPSYDEIVPCMLEHGIAKLPELCKLTPGIPLKPMLAHPTKAISEVLNRFENLPFTCEYKYDGERAQVHRCEDGRVMIFSRNSENLSPKYPDVLERLAKICKPGTTSFVLDCEAVAWDREQKCILPFQVLSTRKRKDVEQKDITVQVSLFAFDLLYLNGQPLIKETFRRRRELLYEHFVVTPGEFDFAVHHEGTDVEEIQTFLEESIKGNCEGLMVKTLEQDSTYEPSKRSRNWLKVKKDYLSGVGDTLDLVVMGGYIGRGKRTGGYGGYLLACYNPETEEYQSICKIGTGFSDEDLAKHSEFFKQHVIPAPKSYYVWTDNPNIKPDVWFEPVQVWEVKAADLSISPVHKAGMGLVDPGKGISLRFPRFIRIRDDKKPDDATTAEQVADMYRSQDINVGGGKDNAGGGGGGADDGFEY